MIKVPKKLNWTVILQYAARSDQGAPQHFVGSARSFTPAEAVADAQQQADGAVECVVAVFPGNIVPYRADDNMDKANAYDARISDAVSEVIKKGGKKQWQQTQKT